MRPIPAAPILILCCWRLSAQPRTRRMPHRRGGGGCRRRPVDDAGQGLRRHPLQPPRGDHVPQRHRAASGVDVLDRRARRSRRSAARGRRHHVRRHALAERAVRVRPDQRGLSAALEVPPGRQRQCDRRVLLRYGQPRCVLRRRQDHLQPARRPHRCGRCQDRPRAVEDADRRRRQRRNRDDGAAGRQGSGDRRRLGRRVRHLRLDQGTRPEVRQRRLDRPQHRSRRGHAGEVRATSSRPTTAARTSARAPGARTAGAPAVRRCGAGCPTTRISVSSTTAPATPVPTTPSSAPATTSGPRACWRAARRTGRWCGPISSRRTTTGTSMPPARWCWRI